MPHSFLLFCFQKCLMGCDFKQLLLSFFSFQNEAAGLLHPQLTSVMWIEPISIVPGDLKPRDVDASTGQG